MIEQYTRFVKPAFDQFVAPSRRYADVIIPWQRGNNLVAIDLITEHIRTKLQQHQLRRIYPNLEVIPSNYQVNTAGHDAGCRVVIMQQAGWQSRNVSDAVNGDQQADVYIAGAWPCKYEWAIVAGDAV